MRIATFRYKDFDGAELVGECQVRETSDGFCVWGLTGPQGCSKIKDPAIHWKPVKAAIVDLLGGRELLDYKVAE